MKPTLWQWVTIFEGLLLVYLTVKIFDDLHTLPPDNPGDALIQAFAALCCALLAAGVVVANPGIPQDFEEYNDYDEEEDEDPILP